ncbi:hypothetical protein PsorP6_002098 [Peronosclerospora sorghi]|uniref:Uncharacterized protein n=1 Tax=Peronosclerospora sorghi TaxID=230839 RepID=A0ACC0WRA9_9STRA|nr:hypothetical protein PsorP6_002098 [Peronosclerospora sorghi]
MTFSSATKPRKSTFGARCTAAVSISLALGFSARKFNRDMFAHAIQNLKNASISSNQPRWYIPMPSIVPLVTGLSHCYAVNGCRSYKLGDVELCGGASSITIWQLRILFSSETVLTVASAGSI